MTFDIRTVFFLLIAKWSNNWIDCCCCYYWWNACRNWRFHASNGAASGGCNCGFSSVLVDRITLRTRSTFNIFEDCLTMMILLAFVNYMIHSNKLLACYNSYTPGIGCFLHILNNNSMFVFDVRFVLKT